MATSNEIVFSITTAAMALANGLSGDEISLLSSVFTQLGDTLATISAARSMDDNSAKEDKKT